MVLFEDVLKQYGKDNVKILFRPNDERPYLQLLSVVEFDKIYIGDECFIETIYFKVENNETKIKSMPYLLLQDLINFEQAYIVIK